ncbi:MAG: PAS domain S-box protein, partial [Candidatus Aminicenantes bacterium]|nr:PAS domain S-box protein [Candidatus Aminicenantes bacterium]
APRSWPDRQVTWVWEEEAGRVWVGTESRGLFVVEDGRWRRFLPDTALEGQSIVKTLRDSDGVLWIGTVTEGLFAVDQDRILDFSVFDALAGEEVADLFIDREGSLWVGLRRGGLVRIKERAVRSFSTEDGLPDNTILSVCPSPDGGVWIATPRHGVSFWKNGVFTNYSGRRGFPDATTVVYAEPAGRLWIGTWNSGLFVTERNVIRSYGLEDGLPHQNIHAIYRDRRGRIWVGTEGGACIIDDGVPRLPAGAAGAPRLSVISFLEDRQGTMWMGTDGQGLVSIRDDRWDRYGASEGLPSAIIRSIHEDRDGVLWLGTYGGGLVRFNNGVFHSVTTAQGLFDDIVHMILEDGREWLWMSCNRGIFRAERRALAACADGRIDRVSCVSYGRREGMKSEECNGGSQPSGCLTTDGRLIVPTFKGIAVLDTSRMTLNPLPPPVLIEGFTADGREIPPEAGLVLPAGTKRVEIRYTGLSFVTPEKVMFRYLLEGFDTDWLGPVRERTASYTSIPPGRYTFRLTARNNDGVWNEAGAAFPIEIKPRIHQRAWFYPAVFFGVIALGAAIYFGRVRTLRRNELRLERLVGERTRRLTEEIAERKRVGDALRESEERYRTIIENSNDAILITRPEGAVIFASPSAQKVLGVKPEGLVGPLDFSRILAEDKPVIEKIRARALKGEAGVGIEYRLTDRAGRVKWISHSWSPVLVDGRLTMTINFLRDVTERRQAHERIKSSLQEKEVLLKEIHHRVKNNMQVVSSMLSLQAWALRDRRVNGIVQECQSRIRSMALVHEKLYQSKDLAHIGFADYLGTLVDRLAGLHKIDPKKIKLEVEPVRLSINTAVPCGLIVNELLTNALKHAFPAGRPVRIVLRLQKKSRSGFVLEVRDYGIGLPDGIDLKSPKTLGLQIVSLLVTQLDGRLECVRKNGTAFRIVFPEKT